METLEKTWFDAQLDRGWRECALLPTGNKARFASLPEELVEKLDLVFYSDVDRAVATMVEI